MHRGLHGRGALFDTDPPGLASRLVGLRRYQLRSNPYEHPKELPFVVFAGGRGLGKSAVLRELRDAYRGHTPVALIDGEERQFAGPPAERPAESWSPVGQALTTIAEQLAEPVTGAGRIGFPRLTSGLLAVAAGGWSDRDVPRIRQEAERILLLTSMQLMALGVRGPLGEQGRLQAHRLAQRYGSRDRADHRSHPGGVRRGDRPRSRRLRRAATWYRDYPNAGGNPKLGLILLSSHFRAGGDSRTHAERYLVRALLADLDDAYAGVMQRSHRLGRPVVLIDNVQERAGLGLLEPVLRDRADGIADHVAFFAALRGYTHGALRNASRRTLPEVARHTGWEPGTSPSSRALLVALPPLTRDDTLHLVGGVSQGLAVPPQLPYATHRLSGGSPLGVTLLAESARQNLPQGAKSRPVAHLRRRRPRGQRRPAHLSGAARPARTRWPARRADRARRGPRPRSACVLAEVQLSDDFGASGVLALEERLAEEGWTSAAGQFVGDPFLRALLLLRLHHHDPDHARWQSVHRALIDHYGDGDQPDGARYRLHRTNSRSARRTSPWRTCATPSRAPTPRPGCPRSSSSRPRPTTTHAIADGCARATSAVTTTGRPSRSAAPTPPSSRRTAWTPYCICGYDGCSHAIWQLTDPLVLPDPKVSDRLRFELEQLSNLRPAGNPLLWRASREWPSTRLAGHPLRIPGDDDDNVNGDL